MGLSLQDQLLKAGIADKKQAKKARHEKRTKGGKTTPEINRAQQDQLAKARKSHELNRQLNQEKARQEKLSQVRQLIEINRLELDKCEEPYYFKVGTKIKKLYVNEGIAKKLSRGELAIVSFGDFFEIVPYKVAQKIAERDPDSLVVLHNT